MVDLRWSVAGPLQSLLAAAGPDNGVEPRLDPDASTRVYPDPGTTECAASGATGGATEGATEGVIRQYCGQRLAHRDLSWLGSWRWRAVPSLARELALTGEGTCCLPCSAGTAGPRR